MKEFITNLFNAIGLGVNGFIANITADKTKELFPKYTFHSVNNSPTETIVSIVDENGEVPFVCKYTHKENGRITNLIITEQ